MARDPVCGMEVANSILTAEHDGETFAFCSSSCQEAFSSDPAAYLTAEATDVSQDRISGLS